MAGGMYPILLKTRNYGYLCTCVDVSMTLFQCEKIEILFHLQDNIGTRNQCMQSTLANASMIYHKHKVAWTLGKLAEEFPAMRKTIEQILGRVHVRAGSQYIVQAHPLVHCVAGTIPYLIIARPKVGEKAYIDTSSTDRVTFKWSI